MAIKIEGLWAYTIQGFMDTRSVWDGGYNAGPPDLYINGANFDPRFDRTSPVRFLRPMLAGRYISPDSPHPAGFYPYSEIGYMFFDPYRRFLPGAYRRRGAVWGRCRVNTAGYPNRRFAAFRGSYELDPEAELLPMWGHIPLGLITTQFDNPELSDHLWDYAFVMNTIDEMNIATNGRVPRPGVATGTMKRIQPSALFDEPPI